jgi:uncharacterized protein
MICDTGPLVALIDVSDPDHARCVATLASLPVAPLIVTWPCLTETMHFAYRMGGINAQNEIWGYIADGLLQLYLPAAEDAGRMHELMNQYADMPMDLADASLVVAAECLSDYQLFTLDEPLRAVRVHSRKFFEVLP